MRCPHMPYPKNCKNADKLVEVETAYCESSGLGQGCINLKDCIAYKQVKEAEKHGNKS